MASELQPVDAVRSVLARQPLTVATLLRKFAGPISVTWLLTLCETTLTALVPLFIGFAIDGLMANETSDLMNLAGLLAVVIIVGMSRRVYDTRAYGTIRVELGKELAARSAGGSVSRTNARLGMGRELADFLEEQVPDLMSSLVKLVIALVILFSFHAILFYSAVGAGVLMLMAYGMSHRRFFRLNAGLNGQVEKQVGILTTHSPEKIKRHLTRLRRFEIRISDTEAVVYGVIFTILLGFIVFNLWFAAARIDLTAGRIFAIMSYSWEFIDAALVLPATLQGWSRLSEIMQRINRCDLSNAR